MKELLIVVDMLNDFCYVDGALSKSIITGKYYAAGIIGDLSHRIDDFRNDKNPIIWLCDSHAEDDKEFARFPKHAVKGTWGAEVIAELFPDVIEKSPLELMIPKTRYSGFYGTDLEYQLMRIAPTEVTVVGVCTSICVMDTVGGLANRDYTVYVPRKEVTDFDPASHEAALARMENLYGATIL